MDWLCDLLTGTGVAHVVFVLSLTIASGVLLERIRLFGISLGATWILFAGIFMSQLGLRIEPHVEAFIKQFGLILFVFSIGLQVGPGFFSSLRKGGIRKNAFMLVMVLLSIAVTLALAAFTGTSLTTMVGVMSGAVVSTPSLGAAEQTLYETSGSVDATLAQGYAVAYPFAVVLPILCLSLMKVLMRIDPSEEKKRMEKDNGDAKTALDHMSVIIENPQMDGLTVGELAGRIPVRFVVSRIRYADGKIELASRDTVVHVGDRLYVITGESSGGQVMVCLGSGISMSSKDWGHGGGDVMSRTVTVTRRDIHGRTLGNLRLRSHFDINVTRVIRSGVDLLATHDLMLQMGDTLVLVGSEESISEVSKIFGNSSDNLLVPNIVPMFVGIFLGVLLGSLPIAFPMMPQPIKLGLAGGPLVVAILLGRFAPNLHVVTYTTRSANMMLKEIGLSMFMAGVGLSSGSDFISSISAGGYVWILYGIAITLIPFFIAVFLMRRVFGTDFYTMSGILAGSFTSPVLLAYAGQQASSDIPSVNYATVYPLATFVRILAAQTIILLSV